MHVWRTKKRNRNIKILLYMYGELKKETEI